MRVVKNLNPTGTSRWNTSLDHYACAVRPVAAIMVTRISGFRALAERDPNASQMLLSKSYKLQEYYCQHYGCTRLVKMGDTVLVGFDSVEQATECALKIERSARKMFNHKLQIGIHMGEVRYVDGDFFGSPVNIAYDIQKAAKPGEVLVSALALRSLNSGTFEVEQSDITEPMEVLAFKVKTKPGSDLSIWNNYSAHSLYSFRDAI